MPFNWVSDLPVLGRIVTCSEGKEPEKIIEAMWSIRNRILQNRSDLPASVLTAVLKLYYSNLSNL